MQSGLAKQWEVGEQGGSKIYINICRDWEEQMLI